MGIIEGAGGIPRRMAGVPGAGTTEVQTLTLSDVPASGKFRVGYNGSYTDLLDWNVSAADMQTALRALPTIAGANVGVGLVGQVYTLTFAAELAKRDLPMCTTADNTLKTAGAADITIAVAAGTPGVTAAFRGCPVGTLVMDTTNGDVYVNSSTTASSPVWEKVGGQ